MDWEKIFHQNMKLTIANGHSLYLGHKPSQIKCEEGLCENILSEKTPEDMASFGLFGGSANNMNTFYPDITADDWTPKDEDFIEPMFRLFSETTVVYMGIPIDFSQGVVQSSMQKLRGQTVNTDHETGVVEAIGSVSKVVWQNAYKKDGVSVPGGINGILKIDAKSNPRIARGILMDPPSIHSNSVTLRFAHKKSHDIDDFWEKAGSFDENGEMYRLVATEIKNYKETSLVGHGADPYAQKTDASGSIINPTYADTVYDFSADNIEQNQFLNLNNNNMDFTQFLTQLGLQDSGIKNWEELVAHFAKEPEVAPEVALFNALLEVDKELTPESLTALQANQIPENAVILEEGEAVITDDQQAILTAVTDAGGLEAMQANITLGKNHLETIRNNAVAHYKVLHGEAASEEIINTIMKADLKAAQAFEASYHAEMEKSVPLTCADCNSTNVSRASTGKPKENQHKETSHQADVDFFAKKNRAKPSDLHKKTGE